MQTFKRTYKLFVTVFFALMIHAINAMPQSADSLKTPAYENRQFYDSLKYKAEKKKVTKLLYDFLVSPPHPHVDKKSRAINYFKKFEGKIISEIHINRLDVFGPTLNDTTKTTKNWAERFANNIHTKSNVKTLQKNMLIKVGDRINPELIYENERIIRSLSYIKDARFIIEPDSVYKGLVKVTLLTQDRFSFGVTGEVNGHSSAALEVYDKNIFGIGHELSVRFVGHTSRTPYFGYETFYKIRNIDGKFMDITMGYINTYLNEGVSFNVNKPFITPSIKWGGGANAIRMFRTYKSNTDDPVLTEEPMDLSYYSFWAGHNFNLNTDNEYPTNFVLSAGFYRREYFERPDYGEIGDLYFSNSTFFTGGISFSQRHFVQDQLVYSYGVTEDIPKGFKNEIVYGYDINEFGNRHYAHIFISNGNILPDNKGYLYVAGSIGGYFTKYETSQGILQGTVNYISKQINAGRKRFRFFTRANYTLGVHRFDVENLTLNVNNHIRGFRSRQVAGKQRLSLNTEYVLFLRHEIYNFNLAMFAFADVGVIGSNKKFILTQNYYSGIGMGIRLHNENLVFKTFYIRLAFYPFHPSDMSFVGFILDEQSKRHYYSFEPTAPRPFRFE